MPTTVNEDGTEQQCQACDGYGKRLNPELLVTRSKIGVLVRNPQQIRVLVKCSVCNGTGRQKK